MCFCKMEKRENNKCVVQIYTGQPGVLAITWLMNTKEVNVLTVLQCLTRVTLISACVSMRLFCFLCLFMFVFCILIILLDTNKHESL